MSITGFLDKINFYILNPIIWIIFGLAFIMFFWGIIKFIAKAGSDKDREEGKRSIVFGLIGMLIMFSVYGIIHLIIQTIGAQTTYPFS